MATTQCKPGERLHQIKSDTPSDEAPWQQLMVFNYVLYEALDAMQQEQATGNHTPINHHWQQFVHHLRISKPKLGAYLDSLPQLWQVQESPEAYLASTPSVKTKQATVMTSGYPPLKSDPRLRRLAADSLD